MKAIITTLLLIFCCLSFAAGNDSVGKDHVENPTQTPLKGLTCEFFKVGCMESDQDRVRSKLTENTQGQIIKSDLNRQTHAQEIQDINRVQPNR